MADDVEQLVLTISADVRQMQRALDRMVKDASSSTRQVQTSFDRLDRSVNATVTRIGSGFRNFGAGLIAGAGLASIDGFARTIRSVVKDAADLVDLSQKIGFDTDDLQKLQFAFSQAGVEADAVDKVLTQWGKRIGEAYTQGGPLAQLLKANNVSLTDGEGRLRSSAELLDDMADLIGNAGSEQEQLTIATIAFGKAGADAVVAFKDGAAGLSAQKREAEKLGLVIDKQLLAKVAEFDDNWEAAWMSFAANGKAAILDVLTAMSRLTTGATPQSLINPKDSTPSGTGWLSRLIYGNSTTPKDNHPSDPIDQRIAGAFSDPPSGNEAIETLLRQRFGQNTVVPDFGGGGSKSAPADRYKQEVEQLERRVAAIKATTEAQRGLNPLVEDYGYAVEKAQIEQELLAAATQQGLTITPELREQIGKMATGYAEASVAAAQLTEQQDRLRQTAEDFRSLGKEVVSGFISDLRQGTSAVEALQNALNRIADKLLDMALNNLFENAFGGGKTGGSGGGSLFSSIFSGLGKLLGFAEGGYTGNGGASQPAGVVHGGEFVFSKPAVDRIGVGRLNAMHKGLRGYASGGLVMPSIRSTTASSGMGGGALDVNVAIGVENGNLVPLVTVVSGQVAGRMVKQVNKGFPQRAAVSGARGI